MNWLKLETEQTIATLVAESAKQPVLIFKHSTRCSISATALNRLERAWNDNEMQAVKPYFLDLIAYRPISGKVAEIFDVTHESPQLLLINNGACVYHSSHFDIAYEELSKRLADLKN